MKLDQLKKAGIVTCHRCSQSGISSALIRRPHYIPWDLLQEEEHRREALKDCWVSRRVVGHGKRIHFMDSEVSVGPDIIQQCHAALYAGFSRNDGLGPVSMDFQENYCGLELPFTAEVNFVRPVESRGEAYVQKAPMVHCYQGELSYDEEERRKLRRDRNKVAASKCRKKRKEHLNNLAQMSDELEGENISLHSHIGELQAEIKKLEGMLDSHTCSKIG